MLYDPERKWLTKGICRPEDDAIFFAPSGVLNREPVPSVQAKWDKAKEICKACPVLAECQRDTLGEHYGVWGGLDEFERSRLRRAMPAGVKRWDEAKRLRWAQEIARLREAEMSWKKIQFLTGLPESASIYLLKQWKRHQEQLRTEAAKVVDLPLPEPEGREKTPFPEKPGRCHAWVRRHASNLIADGWYKGETRDGTWIYIQFSGRASSYMWARAEDVQIYHPQTAVILEYRMRPDAPAA